MLTPQKKKRIAIVIAIIALIMLASAIYLYLQRNIVTTDDAQIVGQTIVVRPKVSGYIKKIYIQNNQVVKKGTLLAEIDPKDYQLAYDSQKANLTAIEQSLLMAKNKLATLKITEPAKVSAADAQVAAAQADLQKARDNERRTSELIEQGACSQQAYTDAVAAAQTAQAHLAEMQSQRQGMNSTADIIAQAENNVKKLEAEKAEALAALKQTKNNLANTKIYAAQDGIISQKAVESGSFVNVGTPICSLVNDDIWVQANFKETQLQGIKIGDPVIIHVDAYPNTTFKGRVNSLQAGTGAYFSLFPPENATGNFVKVVQRIPIKITFENLTPPQKQLLKLGMSVEPAVYINGAKP